MSIGLSERPNPGRSGAMQPKAGVPDRRNHLAPQERRRRLAVEEHHRLSVALVEVGQAEASSSR